ncbi:TIGR03085 family metal-binding protein [Ornithinimicrobium cryptoxanthini]|uniref:TIGR03085 family metal-binding protein n=1 Tax=Ornithinimicrobium cryptoxanthini TaxID=2934161 RepID=A0ABY4YIU0_9MICO|nr:TIGR03085 family metal-binding protein [Ornithinimicrobium cryptoxanthini]USQ76604.1 TIGR03085 family metal-binding protein [Ornithinimicrobium cryptoxanthini]
MTHLAALERQALCDTFDRVGPSAPTLCEPWSTAELAAHLVIRDSRPDLAAGTVIPALSDRLDEAMSQYATRPWGELVHLVRSGPPVWSPTRMPVVDNAVNLTEFFVHHEDVLRGEGQVGAQRDVSPELERALWSQLTKSAKLIVRKLDAGVVLVAPGHGRKAVKGPTEAGTAVLTGAPGELVLALSGRLRVADVEITGPEAAVAAVREAL